MTQKAIKTELLLLDRGGGRGGERGGRRKEFGRSEGGREGGEESQIGTDEERGFKKTAAYIIPLIKDSAAFILESCFWSVCAHNMWVRSCLFAPVYVRIIL